MDRKSLRVYRDSLNVGKNCVRKTLQGLFRKHMNHSLRIGITFGLLCRLFNAMFFINGDICEELVVDKHYVGPTRNGLALSFHVVVNCHGGYMVLVHARDKKYTKSLWLVKALSSPNFVPTPLPLDWGGRLLPKH